MKSVFVAFLSIRQGFQCKSNFCAQFSHHKQRVSVHSSSFSTFTDHAEPDARVASTANPHTFPPPNPSLVTGPYSSIKTAPRSRRRNHRNPLTDASPAEFSKGWLSCDSSVLENHKLPIVLDLGCNKGRWVLQMGENNLDKNFIGVDIRDPVIRSVQGDRISYPNVYLMELNCRLSLRPLLKSIREEGGLIEAVTIQFPDPYFKKKHHKRRMVTEQIVSVLAEQLSSNTSVYVQTDVPELMEEMTGLFQSNGSFQVSDGYTADHATNPPHYAVLTEREWTTLYHHLAPVYRQLYVRK